MPSRDFPAELIAFAVKLDKATALGPADIQTLARLLRDAAKEIAVLRAVEGLRAAGGKPRTKDQECDM